MVSSAGRLRGNRIGVVVVAFLAALPSWAVAQGDGVPTPRVIGPIEGPGRMLLSTPVDLPLNAYIEQEFFIEGESRGYDLTQGVTPAQFESTLPYKTRILVRRPISEDRFNGTVILEWLNVTAQRDVDTDWIQTHEHLLRSGYAWVGVSAQRVGVQATGTGLREGNAERYGDLDVTGDSVAQRDELSYDIFSQAAEALRAPSPIRPLGPLVAEVVIASGHSQSAIYVSRYFNSIQPLTGSMDGFLVRGGGGQLRTDLGTSVFKLNTETDLVEMGQVASRQPDSRNLRTWEVAGSSHADEYYMSRYWTQQEQDFATPPDAVECDLPPISRIPFRFVMFAAVDHLRAWITEGDVPPSADPIELLSIEPEVEIRRDSLGLALGGIRLPQLEVPTARNTGMNSGGGFCRFFGAYEPFDEEMLGALYQSHEDYFRAFLESVNRNVQAGFILPIDAERMIEEARESSVGRHGEPAFRWD